MILFFGYYYIFLIILFFELLSFFKTISELLIIVPERVNLKPSIEFMHTFLYSKLFFWKGEGGGGRIQTNDWQNPKQLIFAFSTIFL